MIGAAHPWYDMAAFVRTSVAKLHGLRAAKTPESRLSGCGNLSELAWHATHLLSRVTLVRTLATQFGQITSGSLVAWNRREVDVTRAFLG
jgi:hypothetical protein